MSGRRARPEWDVAIHAPAAGPLYGQTAQTWTGGAELQAYYVAQALAARGLRVAHILHEDPGLPANHGGVDLVQQVVRHAGPWRMRRVAALIDALSRTDASIYVQRTAGLNTGVVGAFARARGRRFISSLSSEVDLERGPLAPRDLIAKEAGLHLANRIVAQTANQQRIAARRFGARSALIRSFCEARATELNPRAFLWIGGIVDYKQPLSYVELARRVPEAEFVMVATPRSGSEDLAAELTRQATRLANLHLEAPRPRKELLSLYAQAVAVVNTSLFEGFPNTFMEGWACGVPALSLRVDPDGLIAMRNLGAVAAGSSERLAELARAFWAARHEYPHRKATSGYIREEHEPSMIGDAWMRLVSRSLG